ncbi:hypothetical protein Dimus_033391 [Dionaea muscipula]
MTTPFPHYDRLLELYVKDRATGERAMTAKEKAHQWSNHPTTPIATNAQNPTQSSVHASKHEEGSIKGKKRKGKLDDSADVFLKRGFEAVIEALREGNAILREVRPRVYSAEEVFAGLQNIGVEQPLHLKAYRFLNADAGRIFRWSN